MTRRLLLAALAALAMALATHAQDVRVVNGDKYIAHAVRQGETLFGLSRHYAVPLNALLEANPGAAEGLSIGQVILVPVKEQSKKELKTAPRLDDGALVHKVARKETIYGVARKYGITQEDLRRMNPDLQYGIHPGMELRIQVATSTAAPPAAVQPAAQDSARFHLVQPGETLFSLGKNYGLTPDRIKEANGGLPDGLKAGTYLRIPGEQSLTTAVPAVRDTTPAPPPGVHRRIAFLLPFTSTGRDTSASGEGEGQPRSVTDAALEFRAGVGMALDTLEARGLNADVHVFDTGMKPDQWAALFRSDAVRGMDLYIGPFHRAAVESLVRITGDAPVICPVPQSNKVILGNPTVSKALGSRTDRLKQMARYLAFHHGRDNIMLLKPEIYAERDLQGLMIREMQQALQGTAGRLRDSLPVVSCGRRDVAAAIGKLDPHRPNILIVPSEDVEFITTVLSKFSGLVPKHKITVFGMDSWPSMTTLEVAALVKLNVHVPANANLDYASPRVNDFISAYRAAFHNEPGEYAFLGYDVTLFYVQALMQFGKRFPEHYGEVAAQPIYLEMRMEKLGPENGWSNAAAVVLEYLPEGLVKAK
ncbi:MAG: LysM peptidoglycan-binding domain-containing protein [Flavobacteriales bacterium]|nr:LysM peptidoglycan-binding domain-containing protein [Flavobacteriales bacterium]